MKKKFYVKNFWQDINLPLLIFLVLFLNVKFVVKIVALVLIILMTRNFRFGLSFKNSRLPIFYAAVIIVELFKYLLITRNYSFTYALVFCMGILQWAMCLMSIHYIKLATEQDSSIRIHNTIKAFFLINFLVSISFFLILLFHPSWLSFWGHGKDLNFSHASAGDAILGITFDASTVNAALNSIGLIYFLYKKENTFAFLNIFTISICTSNLTLLLTLGILALMIFTVRSKQLRIRSIITAIALLILYFPFSPRNKEYIRNYFVQLYIVNKQQLPLDTVTYRLRLGDSIIIIKRSAHIPNDSLYTFNNKFFAKALFNFVSFKDIKQNDTSGFVTIPEEIYQTKPGKFISFIQTFYYLKFSFKHFLFGSGIGNFSSKLAFRAAGTNALGSYPKKYNYASSEFIHNHLITYLYYYEAEASKHSVLNYPFSVYNQIFGEYGIIGAILFGLFYVGFFLKRFRMASYGKYLILMILAFFVTEYWFEFFSLVVLFELFIFIDLKENQHTSSVSQDPATAIQ